MHAIVLSLNKNGMACTLVLICVSALYLPVAWAGSCSRRGAVFIRRPGAGNTGPLGQVDFILTKRFVTLNRNNYEQQTLHKLHRCITP